MIKQGKSYSKDGHIAFIVGKEFKTVEGIPTIVEEQAKKFIASDEKTDYIKLGEQFIFFVKENDDLEKIRVAGHEIRTKLAKSAEEIFIAGEGEHVLALAEGLALSNYQFLKYFKDADKKRYKLKDICLLGDFNQQVIEKLNNTNKAVYWSR